mmetsp:Transcript_106033/g.167442  ORF Transcript_106033/g.167442 Transcript_106033/m.167442 type:complete len:264 (-) Transcript_106033:191-982(-)
MGGDSSCYLRLDLGVWPVPLPCFFPMVKTNTYHSDKYHKLDWYELDAEAGVNAQTPVDVLVAPYLDISNQTKVVSEGATASTVNLVTLHGIYHNEMFDDYVTWIEACEHAQRPISTVCSKVLVSSICIVLAILIAIAASVLNCVQGCGTEVSSNKYFCSKVSVVYFVTTWILFLLAFSVFASIASDFFDIQHGPKHVISAEYHIDFYFGFPMILCGIAAITFSCVGCRILKDDATPIARKVVVTGQVLGASSVKVMKLFDNTS